VSLPRPAARPAALTVLTAVVAIISGACARGDDLTTPTVPTTTTTTSVPAVVSPDPSSSPSASPPPSTSSAETSDPGAVVTADAAPASLVTTPPAPVVEIPEVGVPGLDSDDVFCSSWSRFAGSFQVVSVTAAFGSGSPEQLAALEVAASPTVTSAYQQLVESWPDELASEADLVADEFLGPFARRLEAARAALSDVGADDATITAIEKAWLTGLAQRDPTTPEFVVDLSDDVWAVIDGAAVAFAAQRVPFGQDPTLVTNVQTPLTSEYLSVSCPDQGTLSGQEVETP
jgi:hypothetical protein